MENIKLRHMQCFIMINIEVILIFLLCSICDLETRGNLKKKIWISSIKSLKLQRCNIFSHKIPVLKCVLSTQKCARMHHFEAIFKKIPGADPPPPPAPNPHLREGMTPSPTLPLLALRASLKPSASDPGAPAILNCAPQEKKLDTPGYPYYVVA